MQVTVLDMQPIDPPTGGGRLRLLGLYQGLGPNIDVQYVGTYDWPGPGFRCQKLSDGLDETLIPLSPAHFAAAERRAAEVGGRGVIDLTFHKLAALSEDYVKAARQAAERADVVVFSHPWIYPLVRDVLDRDRQLVVYDAHNMEGLLRAALLDDGGPGTEIVREVVAVEAALCRTADLILACSHEDRDAFHRIYEIPAERIRLAPNGAFTEEIRPTTPEERSRLRREYGVSDRLVAIFIGTNYGPNIDATRFISETLASALPRIEFVVIGSAGNVVPKESPVKVTNVVSETEKRAWLQLADIAINPMFGGSGTNIKMFEFMSAGLPIVTTPVGARGIEVGSTTSVVAGREEFAEELDALARDEEQRRRLSTAARREAESHYSWERISLHLGRILSRHAHRHRRKPFFSVVIPTYERHATLSRLAQFLANQRWTDFEVIVVDQSAHAWPDHDRVAGLDLHYIHTDVRGAVSARNTGAAIASGRVIAFTDDDCEPSAGWLSAARQVFERADVVGLEGMITSDCSHDDPDWRPVTNAGFPGVFMTANFFIRTEVFNAINGFDLRFDRPHFREDTDLGWRAQRLGSIPFSKEAWVYHPPQPRSLEREGLAERSRYFENDALLMRKHPEKYYDLLMREQQWTHNPMFWKYFVEGIRKLGISVPPPIADLMPNDVL